MSGVRVRYAPSPTGLQHIGGVRTALYNYFYAKASGGKFVLRVEDTDRERYSDESLNDLKETLEWLGVKPDEGPDAGGDFGPYVQSERVELYREYAEKLVEDGMAYYCFCSPERLEILRKEQEKDKRQVQGYDRLCASLPLGEAKARIARGEKHVIRLRVPTEGETCFDDIILGRIRRKNRDITPDPVLLKSDGFPTYHLANVIDDHLMKITHIMRAQEWVPSTPLHIILYRAFGWEPPLYCHLPMVMGKDGQKLSKRHGSTSLKDFRDKGYLPEAIINYVSLVGWAFDGERELFSRQDLEKCFSIEKIHSAPAVFDYKKLDWFNGHYIRSKTDAELCAMLMPFMKREGIEVGEKELMSCVPLVKERLKVLSDAPDMLRFLFADVDWNDSSAFLAKGESVEEAIGFLEKAAEAIGAISGEDVSAAEEILAEEGARRGVKANSVFMPVRVAVTGTPVSPPLFQSIAVLGKKKTLERISRAVRFLKASF